MEHSFADKPLSMSIYQHGIIALRRGAVVHTNVPHLVTHHSPDGFAFGDGGSGAADLALNILEWQLHQQGHMGERIKCFDGHCFRIAWEMHQTFTWEFLAHDRQAICIPLADLAAWIARQQR